MYTLPYILYYKTTLLPLLYPQSIHPPPHLQSPIPDPSSPIPKQPSEIYLPSQAKQSPLTTNPRAAYPPTPRSTISSQLYK
ncbi:hypothetical protein EAE96_009912 [Botrytis aclada]|nr:hypothetical protein EAE96_009912 [Botrytis aclada]